jgi:hypothetical protein
MRPRILVGIVLILAGLFVTIRGISYTSERQFMKVGDMEARVEERHTIPAWIGVVAIVCGVSVLAAGQRVSTGRHFGPHASDPW